MKIYLYCTSSVRSSNLKSIISGCGERATDLSDLNLESIKNDWSSEPSAILIDGSLSVEQLGALERFQSETETRVLVFGERPHSEAQGNSRQNTLTFMPFPPLPKAVEIFLNMTQSLFSFKQTHAQSLARKMQQLKIESLHQALVTFAHEVGNPLMVLCAKAARLDKEIVADRTDWSTLKKDWPIFYKNLGLVSQLIEHQMQIVRGKVPEGASRHALVAEQVQSVLELLRDRLSINGIELKLTLPSEDVEVGLSGSDIAELVFNLVNNAIDATRGTQGALVEVQVCVKSGDNGTNVVELHVLDSGPGVPDECVSKIANAFFTTKPQGTGLGLFISKQISNRAGGDLVYVRHNSKTKFIVTMPTTSPRSPLRISG